MVKLERLEELNLTSNFFATFPEFVMKLASLKKVTLGGHTTPCPHYCCTVTTVAYRVFTPSIGNRVTVIDPRIELPTACQTVLL